MPYFIFLSLHSESSLTKHGNSFSTFLYSVTSRKFGPKSWLYLELQTGVETQLTKYIYRLYLCLRTYNMPMHHMLTSRVVHYRLWTFTDPDPVINYLTFTLCSTATLINTQSSDTPRLCLILWYINCSTTCTFINSNINLDSISC